MPNTNKKKPLDLHEIARKGNLKKVDASILTIESLCERNDDDMTVFEIAIESGYIDSLPLKFFSIESLKRQHELVETTILFKAAENGCIDKIPIEVLTEEHLLTAGSNKKTVAWQAASSGNLKQFPRSFLSAKALISNQYPGNDGMAGAVDGGHLDQLPADLLTSENMLLKNTTQEGSNRFHYAAAARTLNRIPEKLLTLENLLTIDDFGRNVFHIAALHGSLSQIPTHFLTIELLSHKCAGQVWCKGMTPLHIAAYAKHLDQIPEEFLSENVLLIKAANGKTVFNFAVEGKSLKQIPKSLAAKLKSLHKPKTSEPGCPGEVYAWIKGGIMAVECADKKQRALVGCQKILKNDACLLDAVAVIDEIDSGNWVVAYCGLFDEIPTIVSKKLKTKVAYLYYDDTSGLYGCSLFLNGKCLEEIASENDEADLIKSYKRFGISNSKKSGFDEIAMALINARFRELGICLPNTLTL